MRVIRVSLSAEARLGTTGFLVAAVVYPIPIVHPPAQDAALLLGGEQAVPNKGIFDIFR
jgi:hypothetical protein